jgi:hypothetical protein
LNYICKLHWNQELILSSVTIGGVIVLSLLDKDFVQFGGTDFLGQNSVPIAEFPGELFRVYFYPGTVTT